MLGFFCSRLKIVVHITVVMIQYALGIPNTSFAVISYVKSVRKVSFYTIYG